MFISLEFGLTTTAADAVRTWGDEWENYRDAILQGFRKPLNFIEDQINTVCQREGFRRHVGFTFMFWDNQTDVGIKVFDPESKKFIDLTQTNDPLKMRFVLHKKKDLGNRSPFLCARNQAALAAEEMAADLARTGLTKKILRSISEISRFYKLRDEDKAIHEWVNMDPDK